MATGRSNFVWSNETNFVHVHGITVDKAIFEQILRPNLWSCKRIEMVKGVIFITIYAISAYHH
jgi:hypothetical protein